MYTVYTVKPVKSDTLSLPTCCLILFVFANKICWNETSNHLAISLAYIFFVFEHWVFRHPVYSDHFVITHWVLDFTCFTYSLENVLYILLFKNKSVNNNLCKYAPTEESNPRSSDLTDISNVGSYFVERNTIQQSN